MVIDTCFIFAIICFSHGLVSAVCSATCQSFITCNGILNRDLLFKVCQVWIFFLHLMMHKIAFAIIMDMTTPQVQNQLAFYRSLPKVELHRHLEGSLRVETLLEIASVYDIHTDGARALRSSVQIQDDDPHTFENFLSKFVALRQFYFSREIIERLAREAVEDASKDNIRYLELRFTPVTLSRSGKFPLTDVIDWVISGAQAGQEAYGVMTRLIVSINRHDSIKLAEQVAQLAIMRKGKGIVGLDLAGNEADFSAMPFAGIFKQASQDGLKVTVHAGEWDGAANIIEAIEKISAVRIGHGVRVGEDQRAVALAQERAIPFEVCVTSNYQSGVVPSLSEHPLTRLLDLTSILRLTQTIHRYLISHWGMNIIWFVSNWGCRYLLFRSASLPLPGQLFCLWLRNKFL